MDNSTDGRDSVLGAESDAERSLSGISLIAYPASAEMMDPVIVRKSEPAYCESHSKLAEVSTRGVPVPCQEIESPLCLAETVRSRSV